MSGVTSKGRAATVPSGWWFAPKKVARGALFAGFRQASGRTKWTSDKGLPTVRQGSANRQVQGLWGPLGSAGVPLWPCRFGV
jgi:hypothetical protein